ncbi:hypothetical protein [Micromonospora sp. U21]|uniref:hypothetical protein n=1 Tax=Micromonospora sp. U21 TaxID=2824899 RepID=UPI001B378030|nr:hypothetical protein [Micromonospora sp. U21]MBQ0906413.1 hypothetical protein [Micromonospora sp. U21]
MIPDNPASRYHDLLAEVLKANPSGPFRSAWAKTLGTDNDHDLVMTMAAVASLLPDIKSHVEALPSAIRGRYERNYLAWARPVIVFDVAGHGAWRPESIITGEALDALGMLGDLLSARQAEAPIERVAVERLLARVEDMISEVTAADDLDADSRAFMVQHLSRVADRLRNIRIYGRGGVEEALGRACLATVAVEDAAVQQGPTSRFARFVNSERYVAFRTLLQDAANIIGIAAGGFALTAGGTQAALPPAPPHSRSLALLMHLRVSSSAALLLAELDPPSWSPRTRVRC